MVSVAMLAAIQACNKQPIEGSDTEVEYTTLKFTPEYELDIDVKSIEIGKTDIWCYLYDYEKEVLLEPFKQSEINGSTYCYQLPKLESANIFFVAMPEELLDYMKLESPNYIYLDKSFISLDEQDIYMSEYEYHSNYGCYGYYIWGLDSKDISLSLTMAPRYRKTHLMINFVDFPSTSKIEDIIDKVYPSFRNLQLNKGIDLEEMVVEKRYDSWEGETTWYTMDIYSICDNAENADSYFTLKIETKDRKIYETSEMFNYYSQNEELRIYIDYYYLTNNK